MKQWYATDFKLQLENPMTMYCPWELGARVFQEATTTPKMRFVLFWYMMQCILIDCLPECMCKIVNILSCAGQQVIRSHIWKFEDHRWYFCIGELAINGNN